MSLVWSLWSEDPVLIDGAVHPLVSPILDSSGNIQALSYLVETPPALELTAVTFSGMPAGVVRDDGSETLSVKGDGPGNLDFDPTPCLCPATP